MNTNLHQKGVSVRLVQALKPLRFVGMTWLLTIFLLSFMSYGQSPLVVQNAPALDQKTKTAIIDSVALALNEVYVFPDKAKKMEEYIRKQLNSGKYDKVTQLAEFTEALTVDLRSICHDKHLGVQPLPPRRMGQDVSPAELEKQQLKRMKKENYGFQKLEILPGNIGYLDLRMFADAHHAGATAIAAMNFLANTDAIIFDLRQNGGGSPSMIQLITSYFYDEPVHLNSFYIRKSDSTQQFWTHSHVQGSRMTDTPVYVLTSQYTFSGAEEFTYNLKNLKRATIIGETTGGGAHPVELQVVNELGIAIAVPFGRAVNPITGTNWEGTGIEPDIAVPADKALAKGRILALNTLMDKETDPSEKARLEWAIKGLEVELEPVWLDKTVLQAYTGVYGPRKIWLDDGSLYYQRETRPKFKLIPMGNDMFMLDGLEYFRIQFKKDASGAVIKLVGLYNNGQTDFHERTGG